MSLWRLEWLRLVRTRRLVAVLSVYLFFGFVGPLTARYLSQILGQVGTEGIRIEFPHPLPADGIAQFVSNASQIGLLVVVMVSASALAFDARREMSVFLRTRVPGVRTIVLPAYTVNAAVAIAAFVAGSLAAWYETTVLLGDLPAARMLAGITFGALFLAFAVAAVAFVGGLVRGVLAVSGITLVLLLGLAIVGSITPLGRWLPTRLAGAMPELVRGASVSDYLPAAAIACVVSVAMVAAGIAFGSRREM